MQEVFDIHGHAGMFGGEIRLRPFPEVLKEVQEHITKNYASTLKDDPDESRELVKSYIQKYLENNHLGVVDTEQEELCELIYGEMTGFSFLTKYLYRDDVEEININQWKDVKVTYRGLREGYSGGYRLSGEQWVEDLDYDDVYYRLDSLLGTERDGSYHIKEQDGGYEYRISGLRVEITNTGLAPGSASRNFEADARITIEIPMSFGWGMVPPLTMELRTKAAYMPKF